MQRHLKLLIILLLIFNAYFVLAQNNNAIFNEIIECDSPAEPEPYTIPLFTSCDNITNKDIILKWACDNGFIIKNSCRDGQTFLKDDYFYYKGNKRKVTYLAKAYLISMYDGSVVDGNYSMNEDFESKKYPGMINTVSAAVNTYGFCDYINKENKDLCKKFKEKTESYFSELLSLSKAYVNEETPKNNDDSNNETTYTVTAYKKGYNEESKLIFTDSDKTGKIIVKGTVKSSNGKFLPNATVSIINSNKKVLTDNNGNYKISFKINNNGKEQYFNQDFILKPELGEIKVTAVYNKLIANGKTFPVTIILEKDNHPLANKKISVFFSPNGFYKDGKKIDYLSRSPYFDKLITDINGTIKLNIPMPYTIKSKLNNLAFPEKFFPVTTDIEIKILEEKGQGSTSVSIESPFPQIVQYKVPGNMDAGIWQTIPSIVQIEDFDSNKFKIEIKGAGRFRVKGGKIYKNGLLEFLKGTNVLKFYYASDNLGLDLNKQPDVFKEFLDTNIKVAANFYVSFAENWALDKAAKTAMFSKKIVGDGKILKKIEADSKLGIGLFDYTMNTYNLHDKKNISNIEKTDWVLTGLGLLDDSINFIKNNSTTLGAAMYLEIAKALWENSKTLYNIYKKYRKISDSYRGVIFIPIAVYVEDNDGYRTKSIRACAVRIWKELD